MWPLLVNLVNRIRMLVFWRKYRRTTQLVRVKRHYISGGKGANYETGYNVDVILKKIRFRKTGEKHTKLVTVTMLRCWDERCLSFPEPASSG